MTWHMLAELWLIYISQAFTYKNNSGQTGQHVVWPWLGLVFSKRKYRFGRMYGPED